MLQWAGDPHWSTFTRSTLKPFQALPFVREGGPGRYGWSTREIALLCASHSGETIHTDIVSSMLASADCTASQLQCGCHVPGWYAALGEPVPRDPRWSPIEHNCSGKHAGFLVACRLHGEPLDDYLEPGSPLQRRVATTVADLVGVSPHELPRGTDGCSAPNYALPLSRLAYLYAQLAQGRTARKEGDALGLLGDAMMAHPELVSGTARSDQALMRMAPGDWVTRSGPTASRPSAYARAASASRSRSRTATAMRCSPSSSRYWRNSDFFRTIRKDARGRRKTSSPGCGGMSLMHAADGSGGSRRSSPWLPRVTWACARRSTLPAWPLQHT